MNLKGNSSGLRKTWVLPTLSLAFMKTSALHVWRETLDVSVFPSENMENVFMAVIYWLQRFKLLICASWM
jgi:hypothetical protein